MDQAKEKTFTALGKLKKVFLVLLVGIAGLLLTLAGFNLIELSQNLILYAGIGLLIIAGLMYLLT